MVLTLYKRVFFCYNRKDEIAGDETMETKNGVMTVDTRDCRNMNAVGRAVLYAFASAKAQGVRIVRILHTEQRINQLRPFLRKLQRIGGITFSIEAKNLGQENDPGSLFLRENFEKETADPSFWERDPGVTVVCV